MCVAGREGGGGKEVLKEVFKGAVARVKLHCQEAAQVVPGVPGLNLMSGER